MGINNISEQKSNIDFQTNQVQNNSSRYFIKSNGVDKTPQSDTFQLSNKKDTVKKVAIGTLIVGTAVGLFYLLRGKKPPKKVIEQASEAITETKPKMEITEEAKKIYDDVSNQLHKKTKVTSESIENNLKPKEKTGSWSKDDMKEFYTTLEKESDAKLAAEKAAKEAEAAREKILNEYRKLDIADLNSQYTKANRADDFDKMSDIQKVMYERIPERIQELKLKQAPKVDTPVINRDMVSSDEYSSIAEYVDNYPYNSQLRAGKFDGADLPESIRLMDNVIDRSQPLNKDAYVYRAVAGFFEDQLKFIESLKPGSIISDKSFVSTAKSVDNQFEYFLGRPNSMALRIKLPKGTKGLNINSSEFVLPRNSQIKINSIDKKYGIVECEYILPNMA